MAPLLRSYWAEGTVSLVGKCPVELGRGPLKVGTRQAVLSALAYPLPHLILPLSL